MGVLFLFVLPLGCQTALWDRSDETPYRADPGSKTERGLLVRTARFFQPLLPETNRDAAGAAVRENDETSSGRTTVFDPTASLAIPRRPSQRLFDMTFDDELFDDDTPQDDRRSRAAGSRPKRNALEARKGDSERLRWLLDRIEETPPEQRGVDDAELERLLATFRNNQLDWEQYPELETQTLLSLRKKILPGDSMAKRKAEFRDREIDEEDGNDDRERPVLEARSSRRSSKNGLREEIRAAEKRTRQAESMVEDDLDGEESLYADQGEDRAPPPPMKSEVLGKKTKESLARTATAGTTATTLPETVHAAEALNYPKITQLTETPIVPASYRHPSDAPGAVSAIPQPGLSGGEASGDWRNQARLAADLLRGTLETAPEARTVSNEGRLRLLELVLGNRSEAVRPFTSAEKSVNGFWGNQMLGFSALLDDVGQPDRQGRYVNAALHFDEGLMELRRLCPMKLKNVQIIKDWAGFGVFLPRTEDCRAGEEIALYMELENPTIRRLTQGYNVKTTISYEIRDTASNVVLKKDCKNPVEETTPSRKRDYCIRLFVELPKALPHGQYQLRVSVTDMNSESLHYAEEQIPFKVVP